MGRQVKAARSDVSGRGGCAPGLVDPPADGKVPLLQPEPRVARHRPDRLPGLSLRLSSSKKLPESGLGLPSVIEEAKLIKKLLSLFDFRFLVNLAITFGFFGFWHVVLYVLGWSERPFMPNRRYKVDKVAHNMWYTLLGVVQYTVWEAIYVHCCATRKIPFMTDDQAMFS